MKTPGRGARVVARPEDLAVGLQVAFQDVALFDAAVRVRGDLRAGRKLVERGDCASPLVHEESLDEDTLEHLLPGALISADGQELLSARRGESFSGLLGRSVLCQSRGQFLAPARWGLDGRGRERERARYLFKRAQLILAGF